MVLLNRSVWNFGNIGNVNVLLKSMHVLSASSDLWIVNDSKITVPMKKLIKHST